MVSCFPKFPPFVQSGSILFGTSIGGRGGGCCETSLRSLAHTVRWWGWLNAFCRKTICNSYFTPSYVRYIASENIHFALNYNLSPHVLVVLMPCHNIKFCNEIVIFYSNFAIYFRKALMRWIQIFFWLVCICVYFELAAFYLICKKIVENNFVLCQSSKLIHCFCNLLKNSYWHACGSFEKAVSVFACLK